MKEEVKEKIFIFGASGHAKVVIDIIERQKRYDIAFLVDDDPSLKNTICYGYRVIGGKKDLYERRETINNGVVAIGSNRARVSVAEWLTNNCFLLVSAIHPSAQIARGAEIGIGTVVMAGAIINSDTCIGRNVIINTKASIDHDCIIGDGVHIAPGATLCGAVTVGADSLICAGSTIIPNLTVGRNVIIGAGSTVIRNVPNDVLVAGSPARQIKNMEVT